MKNNELRELQKQEALKRLEILQQIYNMHHDVLKKFKEDGRIFYSEYINKNLNGILYWVDNKKEFIEAIEEVENKYNVFVYNCILNHTKFGDWLSMLYVESNPVYWEDEKSRLMVGLPNAFVYDFSGNESEFGTIQIEGANGGLTRLN